MQASGSGSLAGCQASDQVQGKPGSRYRRGTLPPPPKSVRIVRLTANEGDAGGNATSLANASCAAEPWGAPGCRASKSLLWRVFVAGLVMVGLVIAGLVIAGTSLVVLWLR